MLAIAEELTEMGLVLRYRVEETDDGPHGVEGTFSICSFWLVSALAEIGERERAAHICEHLLKMGGALDLYAEEIEPHTGRQLGNFPQAFTHLALINAVSQVIADEIADGREDDEERAVFSEMRAAQGDGCIDAGRPRRRSIPRDRFVVDRSRQEAREVSSAASSCSSSVGGVSRRYHSASSAPRVPEPAAVTACR